VSYLEIFSDELCDVSIVDGIPPAVESRGDVVLREDPALQLRALVFGQGGVPVAAGRCLDGVLVGDRGEGVDERVADEGGGQVDQLPQEVGVGGVDHLVVAREDVPGPGDLLVQEHGVPESLALSGAHVVPHLLLVGFVHYGCPLREFGISNAEAPLEIISGSLLNNYSTQYIAMAL